MPKQKSGTAGSLLKTLTILITLILFAIPLTSCREDNADAAPESSETRIAPASVHGKKTVISRDELGCTSFSVSSADETVVKAETDPEGGIMLFSVGQGNAEVTVRNTYGEFFNYFVVCDKELNITYSGGYELPEHYAFASDFGAVPNDTASDVAGIQRAMNSLRETGGVVYVPAGVYVVSRIRLIGNVQLKLEGMLADYTVSYDESEVSQMLREGKLAVLRSDKSGDMFLNHAVGDYGRNGCSGFSVTGGMIDMEGSVRCFIWCCADNVLLQNVIMKDCPNNHAIQITGCTNVRVRDCMFAGYNYKDNNTTAEVIQIEPTTPGAIGSSNPASVFDAGEYYCCSNVEISGCYFGKSDEYEAPTYAVGHHGQVDRSAVDGLLISRCLFDNCRVSAIRYLAYSNVKIEENRFLCTRDNSVSPDKQRYQISFYLTDSDVTVQAPVSPSRTVTAYYALNYARIGCINTVIGNNEFVFGSAASSCGAVRAVSKSYGWDAKFENNVLHTDWYTEKPYSYRGFSVTRNRIENLYITDNTVRISSDYASNDIFFYAEGVHGLTAERNQIVGKEVSVRATLNGQAPVPGAFFLNCLSLPEAESRVTVSYNRFGSGQVSVRGEAVPDMKFLCDSPADSRLTFSAEGGKITSLVKNGELILTFTADAGRKYSTVSFSGTVTTGPDGAYHFNGNASAKVIFK